MCGGGSDEPKQTEEERALGEIAVKRWNDYQARFRPIEDAFLEDARRTEGDYAEARGLANTSVQQAFGGAEQALKNNLFASGVNVSSDQFIDSLSEMGNDRALSAGTAMNEADHEVSNQNLQALQSFVNMGQGQASEALGGMGQVAANANYDSIARANRSFDNRAAGLELAGIAGGVAASQFNQTPGVNMQGQKKPLYDNPAFIKRY